MNGFTHGAAYVYGIFTVPRLTSQLGPQLIELRFESLMVTGPPAVEIWPFESDAFLSLLSLPL